MSAYAAPSYPHKRVKTVIIGEAAPPPQPLASINCSAQKTGPPALKSETPEQWFIPNLTPALISSVTARAAHTRDADTIRARAVWIRRDMFADMSVTFIFTVRGSTVGSCYNVRILWASGREGGLKMVACCSCPFGGSEVRSVGWCKHAYAMALELVDRAHMQELERRRQEAIAKEVADRAMQDSLMPGERPRVDHVLSKLDAARLAKHLKSLAKTVEGLTLLAQVFPSSAFPPPSTKHCLRCKRDFDPHYEINNCTMHHPHERISEDWKNSKMRVDTCERCGQEWVWTKFGESREERFCYKGPHETDSRQKVREEGWEGSDVGTEASDEEEEEEETW